MDMARNAEDAARAQAGGPPVTDPDVDPDVESAPEGQARQSVGRPDCLTERQWAGLALGVLKGVADGCDMAELEGSWASDLGVAALKGLLVRLDELMARDGASGG